MPADMCSDKILDMERKRRRDEEFGLWYSRVATKEMFGYNKLD